MKTRAFPAALLVLAVLVPGCRPDRLQTRPANPQKMSFAQAGVTLTVGDEWTCRHPESDRSLFPPTLVSRLGTIRVVLLPPDRSEPEIVADGLRAAFDADPQVAKHSFRRQHFASERGAQGLCISYLQRPNAADNRAPGVENRHYLVKNRAGRCVAIQFLASAGGTDTDAVHRLLTSSLILQ
jgi:hypothetical protein